MLVSYISKPRVSVWMCVCVGIRILSLSTKDPLYVSMTAGMRVYESKGILLLCRKEEKKKEKGGGWKSTVKRNLLKYLIRRDTSFKSMGVNVLSYFTTVPARWESPSFTARPVCLLNLSSRNLVGRPCMYVWSSLQSYRKYKLWSLEKCYNIK